MKRGGGATLPPGLVKKRKHGARAADQKYVTVRKQRLV
jgi:hypothetical protein